MNGHNKINSIWPENNPVMVKKPWGMEYEMFCNGLISFWYLHLKANHSTSLHMHVTKNTVLVVMVGQVCVKKDEHDEGSILIPGDMLFLKRKDLHSTLALEDSWVLEMETPVNKLDLVRVQDAYGRAYKPYEDNAFIPFENRYAFPSREFPD